MGKETPFPNYEVDAKLKDGVNYTIYRVVDKKTGAKSLMKVFQVDFLSFRFLERSAPLLDTLKHCVHPNLFNPFDYSTSKVDGKYTIEVLVPESEGMTVNTALRDGKLDATMKTKICIAIANALIFLHTNGMPHRQLEAGNVLIDEQKRIMLASSMVSAGMEEEHKFAYFPWLGPEMLSGDLATPAADIFAFAMIMYQLLAEDVPFAELNDRNELVERVSKGDRPVIPECKSEALRAMIASCWAQDPTDRPAIGEVYTAFTSKAAYFDGTDMEEIDAYLKSLRVKEEFNSDFLHHFDEMAGQKNDPVAQLIVGVMTALGECGFEAMPELACAWYKAAADQGLAFAQYLYGDAVLHGQIPAIDEVPPMEFVLRAADQGYPDAVYICAVVAYQTKKYEEAARMFAKAAAAGHVGGIQNYGKMLLYGVGVKKDMALAKEYLERGAFLGDPQSQFYLAVLLNQIPNGDLGRAEVLLKRAYAQGVTNAGTMLALMYDDAELPCHNREKALEIFKELADKGDAMAQTKYANLIEDKSESVKYYKLAAQQNDATGLYNYAMALINGIGTDKDEEEGMKIMNKAAGGGYSGAMLYLGKLGDEHYLEAAAEAGEIEALFLMSQRTAGKTAIEYAKLAAASMAPEAIRNLAEVLVKNGEFNEAIRVYSTLTDSDSIIDMAYLIALKDETRREEGLRTLAEYAQKGNTRAEYLMQKLSSSNK